MKKYDADQIKSESLIADVVGRYVDLKVDGSEYKACCPFHDEKTPSFTVSPDKGFYHCFGCGAHGDQIDFVMNYESVDFKSACEILGGGHGTERTPKKAKSKKIDPYSGYTVITPCPVQAEPIKAGKKTPTIHNPKRKEDKQYTPSMVFEYENEDGELIGYVLRLDFGDGVKITPTVTWCSRPDGSQGWTLMRWPEPMPMYGLKVLHENPGKPVMVCEGEKAADAASRLMGDTYAVVSWPGGTNAIGKVDWSAVKNKKILIWPDMDKPGIDAAKELAGILDSEGCDDIKYLAIDPSKEKGWDAADAEKEGMTKSDIISWAKSIVVVFESPHEPPQCADVIPINSYVSDMLDEDLPDQQKKPDDAPFRFLGYNRGLFFYLPNRAQQIVQLSASQHTSSNLISIAPLNYWESEFPKSNGFNVEQAANAMIGKNYQLGVFDAHEHIRGRGAWLDDGRTILHLGDRCFVDGKEMAPKDIPGRNIYEVQPGIRIQKTSAIATSKEANDLVSICNRLSWDNGLSGALLAGWCIIAPVCGVLDWRPHIWITGPSGCGKTTVIKDIIGRVLGEIALKMEGKSTEAGIRQQLYQDARPIIFDEAEAEDSASAKRMQSILDLARVSSSGGRIVKGTKLGHGMSFSIRSCFCFSSINTSVAHYADESRINKLVLVKDYSSGSKDRYDKLERDITNTLTKEYSSKMLARSLNNLHTLQANCGIFIDAATRVFKSRRIADQIGTMLAGLYLCYSTKVISADEAEKWIIDHDWSSHTAKDAKQDSERLIDYIATHRIRIATERGGFDLTIGETILVAGMKMTHHISPDAAQNELRRFGIMIESDNVFIANKSDPMRKILDATPWVNDWGRPLKDIHGSQSHDNKYYSPGIKSRGVILPISLFVE